VLLASMLGHAISYAMLGFAGSLWMLLLARVVSGATSANISTAYAYVADVTTPAQRARAMGRVSSAFGLGFMIGPALGGLLAGGNTMAEANLVRPAVAAGLFSLAAFLAIFVFLPETRQLAPPSEPRAAGSTLLTELRHIAGRPLISQLLAMATVVLIFISAREAIFTLWANHQHALSARAIGGMLAWSGGLIALVQFFGMGWLSKRFGELNLVKCAIVFLMTGWFGLTLATGIPTLLIAMTIGSFGTAFFQTSMQSLLSKLAGPSERGAVLGVYQSSTSMARFLGQAGAGTLYGQLGSNAPFLLGSLAMLPAFAIATRIGRQTAASAARESAPRN
jgi:predicted MFS family arabinose efflux permease